MKHFGLLFFLAFMLATVPALASTFPVDDSRSIVHQSVVRTVWQSAAPTRKGNAIITGDLVVDVELNTALWNGKSGKIYITLAPTPTTGPIRASWRVKNNVLIPGNLQSGERALVYSGPMPADRLRDTLTFTLLADGNRIVRPEVLNFTFELDLP